MEGGEGEGRREGGREAEREGERGKERKKREHLISTSCTGLCVMIVSPLLTVRLHLSITNSQFYVAFHFFLLACRGHSGYVHVMVILYCLTMRIVSVQCNSRISKLFSLLQILLLCIIHSHMQRKKREVKRGVK